MYVNHKWMDVNTKKWISTTKEWMPIMRQFRGKNKVQYLLSDLFTSAVHFSHAHSARVDTGLGEESEGREEGRHPSLTASLQRMWASPPAYLDILVIGMARWPKKWWRCWQNTDIACSGLRSSLAADTATPCQSLSPFPSWTHRNSLHSANPGQPHTNLCTLLLGQLSLPNRESMEHEDSSPPLDNAHPNHNLVVLQLTSLSTLITSAV